MPTLSLHDLPWWRIRYGPSWRYLTASDIAGHQWQFSVADPLTTAVARYLHLLRLGGRCVTVARQAFPGIVRAFELQQNQPLVDDMHLMLLGKLDDAEILARTGVPEKDRRRWQRIFFDVNVQQDPLGWNMAHIVEPEVHAGNLSLANRLHSARAGGPLIARQLLDGPGLAPRDPEDYARYLLTEAQIASGGWFLKRDRTPAEMERFMLFSAKIRLEMEKGKLAKKQLESRAERDKRLDELAERRVRIAEIQAKAALERASAKVKEKAEKQAKDLELAIWHREQQAALARTTQAEMQARIEQSSLYTLEWAQTREPGSPQVAAATAAPVCPATPVPTGKAQRRSANRATSTPSLARAIDEAVDSQPDVPEPSPSLAP